LSNVKFDVVIVGGGFSGTMLAVQMLRRTSNLSVAVVDKGPIPGLGLAYGTKYSCHLLNVSAGRMSALPDEPDHFLRWAQENYERSIQSTSFLPRPVYGRYVGSLLEQAAGLKRLGNFQWIKGHASSITSERSHVAGRSMDAQLNPQLNVQLEDGSRLAAHAVVLAAGNFPPGNLNIPGLSARSERYVRSPWLGTALNDVRKHGSILLIGSGLTSVDIAVALKSEGYAGHIHILSRHGLLPQTHRPTGQWPEFWDEQSPRKILGLLRLVREQIRSASKSGGDWREVLDALRPVTQRIWQALPPEERRRFLRHLRSYWEVHRHRVAPEIGDTIAKLFRDGQATLYAGRVTSYREHDDHVEVTVRDRKHRSERLLRVDRVINCTGPEIDCRRIDDPLIKNLLAQGLARPDALSLGLDVDRNGALIDSSGMSSANLYAIGPVRKGFLWETIAVPEIREQAAHLAEYLATLLARPEIQIPIV
jgi:uncharacterized NAD(P)/FAD-binding protein YdhS